MPTCGYPAYVYVVKVSWGSRGVYLDFFDIQGIPRRETLELLSFLILLDFSLVLLLPPLVVLSQPYLQSCSHSCSSYLVPISTLSLTLLSLVIFYPS